MKMSEKVDAALKWAKKWPQLGDLLKLNAIRNEDSDAALTTVYSDSRGEPFIDGTARHRFIFGLRMVLPWSDGHDPTNAEAERLIEGWRDWVDTQYPENVPDWPESDIESIEALYDVPAVTVFEEEEMAEYSFQSAITFVE